MLASQSFLSFQSSRIIFVETKDGIILRASRYHIPYIGKVKENQPSPTILLEKNELYLYFNCRKDPSQ